MAKIHRADGGVTGYTTTQLSIPPQQVAQAQRAATEQTGPIPSATSELPRFYDQDRDEEFAPPPGGKNGKNKRGGKKNKSRKKGDILYTVAILICLAVFLVSGGMLVKRYFDDQKAESEFSSLAALVDNTAPAAEVATEEAPSNEAKFAALKEKNPDFFGWLSIDGTNLDYPVMYAPDNKDFYLRHDFEGAYSVYGVPYLDEKTAVQNSTIESQNLIIYGHNMKTGTIFGCLTGYKNADYYTAHPQIVFDTLYGDAKYEVFAAFAMDVVEDQTFVYNEYINMDETQYSAYVNEVLARSDVKTAIHPAYGEQLLTLSTCEYSSDNGRYVVVARRVDA